MADERSTPRAIWVVSGHRWSVKEREDEPGCYDVGWLSGPNPGYGFTVGSSTGRSMSETGLRKEIACFLDGVDPGTGYLE